MSKVPLSMVDRGFRGLPLKFWPIVMNYYMVALFTGKYLSLFGECVEMGSIGSPKFVMGAAFLYIFL